MEGSKEQFMEEREWAITMTDELYRTLPYEVREGFKSERAYYPGEHEKLKEEERYQKLLSEYRRAKKALEAYKHERRDP